jgi:hypothetical protein
MVLIFPPSNSLAAAAEIWLDERCTLISTNRVGPFITLGDGNVMTMDGNATRTSADEGKTWTEPTAIYEGPGPGVPSGASVLLRTRTGTIVLVYMDMSTYKWGWDGSKRDAVDDARLDVWSIRSVDEGKTWVDRQQLLDGYCGALIDIIQTSSGEVVVPVQPMLHDPGRHATRTYVSADEGKTWTWSNTIDLGGSGHHDGAMEATLAELKDGRLWMLLRTNLDFFWEAYSEDKGRSWRLIRPSRIDASSAPGYLLRLASNRLALVWNRLYPEGQSEIARRGGDGQLASVAASWYRGELSLAFSEDEGETWTEPTVIARKPGGGLSYAYLYERRPGELWVSTRFSDHICLRINEADFVDSER